MKHFARDTRTDEIQARFDTIPDVEALALLGTLLKRFSSLYAYDRAIDALADIADDLGICDPFDIPVITNRAVDFDLAAALGCERVSDPLKLGSR